MRYYPAFLDLHHKRCLLVGAGKVGCRKLETMLKCGPEHVLVLDPMPQTGAPVLTYEAVTVHARPFRETDLDECFLVVAASGNTELNARVASLCAKRGILCNVVDAPESGSFIVPAHVEVGELVAALSTGGQSPALARKIRRDLQEYLGLRYTTFLTLMGRLRPIILDMGQETAANTQLFRSLVESELPNMLQNNDIQEARALLHDILPAQLHSNIHEVTDGLV